MVGYTLIVRCGAMRSKRSRSQGNETRRQSKDQAIGVCETHYGEADARLIAAAPDMLNYLIDVYKSGGVFDEAEMRAVIERATGQRIGDETK
ncbi:MAG: hypothetical protein WC374_08960 [Phycisphaerae bacterium]|jgi:hypothetical protein